MTKKTKIAERIRRLRNNYVSLVLTPSGTGRTRAFRFSLFRVYCGATAGVVFAGAMFFFSFQYSNRQELKNELRALKNREAHRETEYSRIASERGELQDGLTFHSSVDNKLRIVHDLEVVPEDVRKAGVGGPLTNLTNLIRVGRDKNVDELELALRQAELQLNSYQEIADAQARSRHIFDHTPSIKPAQGPIVSGFCWRRDPIFGGVQFHKGLDIAYPMGTPIYAPADGVVSGAGMKGGYGYCVFIKHGYGFETRYGHCSQLMVTEGQPVKRGDVIALVGATGWATGAHLHYEVLVGGTHVDPAVYVLPDYLTD